MRIRIKHQLVMLFAYTCLTLLLTFPTILYFKTHLIGDGGDGYVHLWNFWWMKESLIDLHQNPFFTQYFYYPHGTSLAFHVFTPFNSLLAIPLQTLFNPTIAYNLIVYLTFILTGWGMYCLTYHLTKNKSVSFLAGFIFTFCPHRMGHALGHLHILSTEFIPFYFLSLLLSFQNKKKFRFFISAVLLALNALCSWYHFLTCLIISLFSCAYVIWVKERSIRDAITILSFIFILTFGLLTPLIYLMAAQATDNPIVSGHDPEMWSADVLSFVVPGKLQSMSRLFSFNTITDTFTGNIAEGSNYIGLAVLLLMSYAIIKLWEKEKFLRWMCFQAGFFFILSLGMHLHFKGKTFHHFSLPYNFLYKHLFFFKLSGLPERFGLAMMFFVSILSAYGMAEILKKLKLKWQKVVFFLVFMSISFEYLCISFPSSTIQIPEFIHQMAEEKDEYAIIHLPVNSRNIFYQTIHQKKLVLGFISRHGDMQEKFIRETPVLNNIVFGFSPQQSYSMPVHSNELKLKTTLFFIENNIKYIIFEKGRNDSFLRTLDFPIVYQDKILKVYSSNIHQQSEHE